MINKDKPPHITTQAIGIGISWEQGLRAARHTEAIGRQNVAFGEAINELVKTREALGDPSKLLGNANTKHGEIAERVEVGVRNARSLIEGMTRIADIESVPRTGPVDYVVDGVNIQSKFINGARNTLDHVISHINKYSERASNGDFTYHIPRDQYDQITSVIKGDGVDGLSARSIRALQGKISQIEAHTGKPFHEAVRPSISTYAEVQQGRVHTTLDGHEQDIRNRNLQKTNEINEASKASVKGMGTAFIGAAAVGGGLQLAAALYEISREKNLADITIDEWKKVLNQTGKGALLGGASGALIYSATNFTDLAAPFAGAVVSSAMGVARLWSRYTKGEIDFEEFVGLGHWVCLEGATVGIATALGQTLCPIPILGAVLGAAAGRLLLHSSRQYMADLGAQLERKLNEQYEKTISALDDSLQEEFARIMNLFNELGDLTVAAFDLTLNINLRLKASVDLARAHGVLESQIIHNNDELDDFMIS